MIKAQYFEFLVVFKLCDIEYYKKIIGQKATR